MQVIKSFFIALSVYSQIPVPEFQWKEEDMKYVFCFFPWVGALIGGCIYFWDHLCGIYHIEVLCKTAVEIAIPIFITGGFHVDGFMDTMDAIHSFRSKERKLEILKDPHIGAFAVIMLGAYGLLLFGAFSEIKSDALLKIVCCGFFLSRCLCGISAVSFSPAKKEGMLYTFAESSHKKITKRFVVFAKRGMHLPNVFLFIDCGFDRGSGGCLNIGLLFLWQQERIRGSYRRYGGIFCASL